MKVTPIETIVKTADLSLSKVEVIDLIELLIKAKLSINKAYDLEELDESDPANPELLLYKFANSIILELDIYLRKEK